MSFQETWITLQYVVHSTEVSGQRPEQSRMTNRSEVGALGFVRQNGLQRDRTSFRGIGGRPQGVDMSRNPNHAPQRVSPKPWAAPIGQAPPQPSMAESPPQVGGHSIGSYLQSPPPKVEITMKPSLATPGMPSPGDNASSTTLAALAGFSSDAEMKEDISACRGRLDAVGLRLSGQDNSIKVLERSLSALREEYSKISQTIDGQSLSRLEACERSIARLDSAFQEFSTSMQREVRSTENLIAAQVQAASPPVLCRLLENDMDMDVLDALHLFLPLHLNAVSDVCLYKRKFNSTKNSVEETDFVVQTAAGAPRVAFV